MSGDGITLMSALGILGPLRRDIIPAFESAHGLKVTAHFIPTNVIREELAAGKRADVLVAIAEGVESFAAEGIVASDSVTPLASSVLGLAAQPESPLRECSTLEAFIEALTCAKSIAMSQTGASGVYFRGLVKRLGIEEEIMAKARIIHQGLTAELVARGEADIAVQQVSELNAVDGIRLLGPFPAEFNQLTSFSAAMFSESRASEVANAFKDFLSQDFARNSYLKFGLTL